MTRLCMVALLETVFLASLAGWPAAMAGEWPGWRGPNRDGKSTDTGLLSEWSDDGPTLLWKIDEIGSGYSSVAVTGGTVYVTGDVDDQLTVFAYDLKGNPKWKTDAGPISKRGPRTARATPTIDDGHLYLLSGNGVVICLDANNGEQRWSRDLTEFGGKPGGWAYAESVLIFRDLAIAKPGGEDCIVALNKKTGETVWKSTGFRAGPEYGSCIAFEYGGKSLICTGTRAGLVCVDAETGKLVWSNDWSANNTANCPTPVYADGYVFWANGYGKGGICMKLKSEGDVISADVAWTTKDMVCHHGGFIIQEGYVYGNNGNGWTCLDLTTGEKMWTQKAVGKGSVCFADGMLYLFSERRGTAGLAACSPSGLEMKGTVTVEGDGPSWAHPVVTGGRLYLRYDRNLYCYDVTASAG